MHQHCIVARHACTQLHGETESTNAPSVGRTQHIVVVTRMRAQEGAKALQDYASIEVNAGS